MSLETKNTSKPSAPTSNKRLALILLSIVLVFFVSVFIKQSLLS